MRSLVLIGLAILVSAPLRAQDTRAGAVDSLHSWSALVGKRLRLEMEPGQNRTGMLANVDSDTLLLYRGLRELRIPTAAVQGVHLSTPARSRRLEGAVAGLLVGIGAGYLWFRGGCVGAGAGAGVDCSDYARVAPLSFGLTGAVVGNWTGSYFVVDAWRAVPLPGR